MSQQWIETVFELLGQDLTENEVENRAVSAGCPQALAGKLVAFIPLACGRAALADSGVTFSPTFRVMDEVGSLGEPRRLSSDSDWPTIQNFVERQKAISPSTVSLVGTRSAEFDAVNKAALKGSRLADLVGSDPIFLRLGLGDVTAEDPSSEHAHLTEETYAALIFDELAEYEESIKALSEHIERNPTAGIAYHNRAVALMEIGETEKALRDFDRAIDLLREDYLPAHVRGMFLHRLGRTEEAITSLDRAIEIDPNAADARRARAFMLRDIGRLEAALLDFDWAIRLEPAVKQTHKDRAALLDQLKQAKASKRWWQSWKN